VSIEEQDMSGKLRSDSDLKESTSTIAKYIIRGMPPMLPVDLYMQLATIHSLLKELRIYREAIQKEEKKKP